MLNKLKIKSIFTINLFLVCLLVIAYCVLIFSTIKSTLKTSLINRGKTEIANFVRIQANIHIPKEIFSESDIIKTQNIFNSFFKEIDTDEILRIKVWNKNAKIIAANDRSIIGKTFSDNTMFQEAIKGKVVAEIKSPVARDNIKEQGYGQLMEVYVPIINSEGEVVGIIETYTILDDLNTQIKNTQNDLIFKIIAVSIPLLGLMIGLFLLFYHNINHRIDILIKFTKVLGSGHLSEKIDMRTNDELSEIANAMNKMGNDLKESLITKNELEKQVKERTIELQTKIGEVEKMNKLMVGRELKIIDLKKEITDLKM